MFVFGGIVADAVPGMPASPTNTILEFNFRMRIRFLPFMT